MCELLKKYQSKGCTRVKDTEWRTKRVHLAFIFSCRKRFLQENVRTALLEYVFDALKFL